MSLISELSSCAQDSTQGVFRLRGLYGRPCLPGRRGLSGEFFRVPWGVGQERVWREDWLANLHDRTTFVAPAAGNNAFSVLDAYASSG